MPTPPGPPASPTEDEVITDFINALEHLWKRYPPLLEGLHHRHRKISEQLTFFATFVAELRGPVGSLLDAPVSLQSPPPSLEKGFSGALGQTSFIASNATFLRDLPQDDIATSTPKANYLARTGIKLAAIDDGFSLPMDQSVTFDIDRLEDVKTFHDYLTTSHTIINRAISDTTNRISTRNVRSVELDAPPLTEIVFLPDLTRRVVEFVQQTKHQDLTSLELTPDDIQRLNAGPQVANCVERMHSEGDVGFQHRVSEGHIIAELFNIWNRVVNHILARVYPHTGTGGGTGRSQAFPDFQIGKGVVEMKTRKSIGPDFISGLFGLEPNDLELLIDNHDSGTGFRFSFRYPHDMDDTLDSFNQVVQQLWTQLSSKDSYFGQGSCHEYSFFVVKDAKLGRMYISRCLPTFHSSESSFATSPPSMNPQDLGIYAMYHLFCIANTPDYSEDFLGELSNLTNLVPVHLNDVTQAGTGPPPGLVERVNLSRGTVGVAYYKEPRDLRASGNPPNYADISSSLMDEPSPPSSPVPPRQSDPLPALFAKPKGKGKAALAPAPPPRGRQKAAGPSQPGASTSGAPPTAGMLTRSRSRATGQASGSGADTAGEDKQPANKRKRTR